jgi:hypothetical protein
MNYLLCTQARFRRPEHVTPLIMTDEEIDFWGGVYLANPAIFQLGISFEQFLAQPRELLPAATFGALISLTDLLLSRVTLLPKQRAVQERLDAADAGQLAFDLDPALSLTGERDVQQA